MTNAAQQLLSTFNTLPKKAQKEVLLTLLRLPLEVSYAAPTDAQLRLAAEALFLRMDQSEAKNWKFRREEKFG